MQGGFWFFCFGVYALFGYKPDAPFRGERDDAVSDRCQRSPWLEEGGPSLHSTATTAVGNPSGAGRQFLHPRNDETKIKQKKTSQNPAMKPHKSSRGGGSGPRVNPQILRVQQPSEGEAQPAARSPPPATGLRSVFPLPAGAHPRRPGRGGGSPQSRSRAAPSPLLLPPTFILSPRRPQPHGAAPPRCSRPRRGRCWPWGAGLLGGGRAALPRARG